MRRIGMAVRVLLVIVLFGLVAGVQVQGGMMGWLQYIYGGEEHETNCISR